MVTSTVPKSPRNPETYCFSLNGEEFHGAEYIHLLIIGGYFWCNPDRFIFRGEKVPKKYSDVTEEHKQELSNPIIQYMNEMNEKNEKNEKVEQPNFYSARNVSNVRKITVQYFKDNYCKEN
jgi:hypothetical protein